MTNSPAWPSPTRLFWLFVGIHVIVWTLLPTLTQPNAPLDVVEMAFWGREWQWGYAKHPPLPAWLTEAALSLSGGAIWSVYLVSQLAVATTFWAVWRLARQLLSDWTALGSVVLLECCWYYNFTTPEFNNNVALYPCWGLAALFLYRAMNRQRLVDWLATGAFIGLGLLAKYTMILLVSPMLLFMALNPEARRHWKTAGPYLTTLVALVVFAPHIRWSIENGFPGVHNALHRTEGGGHWLDHLLNPLTFTAVQLAVLAPLFLAMTSLTGWRWKPRPIAAGERFGGYYLLAVGLGPFACHLALSLLFGMNLNSMYGSQLCMFAAMLPLFWLQLNATPRAWRRTGIGCASMAGLFIVAGALQSRAGARVQFPGRALAAAVDGLWREHFDAPLPIAAGPWWLAGNVALYDPARPSVYYGGPYSEQFDWKSKCGWTDDAALNRQGGVMLWDAARFGDTLPADLRARFPDALTATPLSLPWRARAAAPMRVGVALIPPADAACKLSARARRVDR